jgi:hypothetical protein
LLEALFCPILGFVGSKILINASECEWPFVALNPLSTFQSNKYRSYVASFLQEACKIFINPMTSFLNSTKSVLFFFACWLLVHQI